MASFLNLTDKTGMKSAILFLFLSSLVLSSCSIVETIFKAGMWWAFFLVLLVIGVAVWLIRKLRQ